MVRHFKNWRHSAGEMSVTNVCHELGLLLPAYRDVRHQCVPSHTTGAFDGRL